jgi:hypothetical protein
MAVLSLGTWISMTGWLALRHGAINVLCFKNTSLVSISRGAAIWQSRSSTRLRPSMVEQVRGGVARDRALLRGARAARAVCLTLGTLDLCELVRGRRPGSAPGNG